MKQIWSSTYLLFAITLLCCSCKKLLEVEPAKNQIEETAVFASAETAQAAIYGVYSRVMLSTVMLNGGLSLHGGLSSDELQNTITNADLDAFRRNALLPTTSTLNTRFWSSTYTTIYQLNRVIEGIEKSTALSGTVKTQLLGEALLLRALHYDYLVQLYGPVPLVVSTDYEYNATQSRNDAGAVNTQILSDALRAEQSLPVNYLTTDRIRPSRAVATALLARTYLRLKNWGGAEAAASTLISNTAYRLEANPNGVFVATSAETIWQLKPLFTTANTAEGLLFIPSSPTVRPSFTLTTALANAFETGDARKLAWTKTVTVGGQAYTYPYKYKVGNNSTAVTEYNILFRLGEQLLIRAEARAQNGNLSGALTDLNLIRARASLPASNYITQADVLAAIWRERRIELFAELGFRWLDLKRLETATLILGPQKADWQPTDVLYPLPQTEIDRNPFLAQNPGY